VVKDRIQQHLSATDAEIARLKQEAEAMPVSEMQNRDAAYQEIDKLIKELTAEFNTTTIVVTHDMNSVMEIGDHIVYLYQGKKEWEGTNKQIIFSKNQRLNEFIFASEFLKDAKEMRMLEETGKMPNDRNIDDMIK